MTSYNPNDIEWGYCGNCHAYTGVVNPLMKAKRFLEENAMTTERRDMPKPDAPTPDVKPDAVRDGRQAPERRDEPRPEHVDPRP